MVERSASRTFAAAEAIGAFKAYLASLASTEEEKKRGVTYFWF